MLFICNYSRVVISFVADIFSERNTDYQDDFIVFINKHKNLCNQNNFNNTMLQSQINMHIGTKHNTNVLLVSHQHSCHFPVKCPQIANALVPI